jgi:putative addiction module component (TIGR02574 family)
MSEPLPEINIDHLTVPQKLELISRIWDSIDSPDPKSMPAWHWDVVEERLTAADSESAGWIPVEEAMKNLRKKP